MFRVQCRELSLSSGASSHSHTYCIFLWLLAFIGFGIWVAVPGIKECRSFMLVESTCMNDQPCALLDPLFICSPKISWRRDSTRTSLHTVLKSSASRSLISLRRCMTNPPRLQIMALSNAKTSLHTEGNIIDLPVILYFESITELLFNQVVAHFSDRKYFSAAKSSTLLIFGGALTLILYVLSLSSPGLSKVTTFCADLLRDSSGS